MTMRGTLILLLGFFSLFGWCQGNQALQFIQNKGQWNEGLDFQARIPGGRLGVSAKGFSILLIDQEKLEREHLASHRQIKESDGLSASEPTRGHYFEINFLGANLNSHPIPSQQQEGYYNYFLGNDQCRWASNALPFGEIIYPEIYDGIDLRVTSLGKNLKYDFIVKLGADPSLIQIDYCGVDGLEMSDGDVVIQTSLGTLTDKKPYTYQQSGNERKTISSEYRVDNNISSFFFPDGYDHCSDLIVDPLLIFSTYSGSLADNWGSTATPGEQGAVYSSGVTNHHIGTNIEGAPFPATLGAFQTTYGGNYDISIIKYDSAGTHFLYASYLGGSQNDTPHSLLMDKNTKDLIVLGTTSSLNYPTSVNAYGGTFNSGQPTSTNVIPYVNGSDIVISRISKEGNQLLASTYVGGNMNDGLNMPGGPLTTNYGDEMRGDVITDDQGNVYVSSVTSSSNFPVTPGFGNVYKGGGTDAVVMKFSPDLSSLIWSGLLGGSSFDAAYSIKLDNNQNVVVAGGTNSANFPVTVGAYQTTLGGGPDGWISRIAADGSSVMQATYTGTIAYDQVYFIDLNNAGEIFCFGQTAGVMPVTGNVYNNPNSGQFLQKFNSDLSALSFSTVFGSGKTNGLIMPNISPTAFLVNECDNIFMSGWGGGVNSSHGFWNTTTSDMPITADAHQKNTSGSDFYFIVLNDNASQLVYSTFLGGNISQTHVDGGTSRFDKFGIVYHAVCAGCAATSSTHAPSSDFPTTPGVWSRTNKSKNCNNAAFKFDLSSLNARFQTNTVNFDMPNFDRACYPDSVVFQNISIGGEIYVWDLGDGTVITKPKSDTVSIAHQYQEEGIYQVKLKAIDDNTCSEVDSVTKAVTYFKDIIDVGDGADICEGSSFELTASGGVSYSWISEDGKFQSAQPTALAQPEDSTVYFVTVTDSDGCTRKDTVSVNVISEIDLNWKYDFISDCLNRPSIHVQNLTPLKSNEMLYFDFGDGTTSEVLDINHQYEKDSLYKVKLIGQHEFCVYEESVDIPVFTLNAPNVFTPEASAGFNDYFKIGFGSTNKTPADVGLTLGLTVVNRWGKKVFESSDYRNTWNASDVESGVYFIELKIGTLATCKNWLHVVK
jgi:hypothetical protein